MKWQLPNCKPNPFVAAIVLGLLLVNLAVFVGVDRQTTVRWMYDLDPRHWPTWYGEILWIIAVASVVRLVIDFLDTPTRVTFYARCIWGTTAFAVLLPPFFAWCPLNELPRTAHVNVYTPYFYNPINDLLFAGTVSWTLYMVPVAATLAVLLLFYLRKKNRGGKETRHYSWRFKAVLIVVPIAFLWFTDRMVVVVFPLLSTWKMVDAFLKEYYFTPMSLFLFDGTITWQLFIVPIAILTLIGIGCTVRRRTKRNKNVTENS